MHSVQKNMHTVDTYKSQNIGVKWIFYTHSLVVISWFNQMQYAKYVVFYFVVSARHFSSILFAVLVYIGVYLFVWVWVYVILLCIFFLSILSQSVFLFLFVFWSAFFPIIFLHFAYKGTQVATKLERLSIAHKETRWVQVKRKTMISFL